MLPVAVVLFFPKFFLFVSMIFHIQIHCWLLAYSSVNGHLNCFLLLCVMNKAAVNIFLPVLWYLHMDVCS